MKENKEKDKGGDLRVSIGELLANKDNKKKKNNGSKQIRAITTKK